MPFPYIFTFYSYKGGVGRSMALLNVAYALAGKGRHVLVVDMDLEAPGISAFLQRNGELAPPAYAHPKDILTLLDEVLRVNSDGGPPKDRAAGLAPLTHYIRSVLEEKLTELKPKMGKLGRLDVLGTDLDRNYHERLAQLGIGKLPHDRLVMLSTLLHHYFKQQRFPYRPLGIEDFEPPLDTAYDYVLVDSRTGMTELGGLCVGPLADRLVVITGLNDQNVEGTLDFMKETGIQPQARSKEAEPWDEADTIPEDNPSLGPKPTILVASPVPAGEISYKRKRLNYLEDRLGIRPIALSYHPQLALMESVFVRDYRDEYLASEYLRLTAWAMSQVGDDPLHLASEAGLWWNEKKEPAKAIDCALRITADNTVTGASLLRVLADNSLTADGNLMQMRKRLYATLAQDPATKLPALVHWATAIAELAKTKKGGDADCLFEESDRKFAEALRLKPDAFEGLNNWGNALSHRAKTKKGEEADRLFEEASRKYTEAVRVRPDDASAFNNWGTSLSERADTKEGEEADHLFEEANRKYAEAVRLRSGFAEALYNWGAALFERAKTKEGEHADRLFEEADRKYALALHAKSDYPTALGNWGNLLFERARRTRQGGDADRLFEEASRKYDQAIRLKPDFSEVLNDWGNALLERAKMKEGEEADHLFEEAEAKYAEALRLKPDSPNALPNWGSLLITRATTKSGAEASHLLQRAREKLLTAEQIRASSGAYNLACIEAIEGSIHAAIDWLQKADASGQRISKARLAAEKDFDRIRDNPEFVTFVASLPEK